MMDKEEYKRELIRMWDSIRDEHKGEYSCNGVLCTNCPLEHIDGCGYATNILDEFDIYNKVEMWSKEHKPKKLTRLEFEILKLLENEGYKYIVRSQINNIIAYESMPQKLSNCWEIQSRYKIFSLFNGLFQFIKWEDEEPTSIKEVLENCEVEDK